MSRLVSLMQTAINHSECICICKICMHGSILAMMIVIGTYTIRTKSPHWEKHIDYYLKFDDDIVKLLSDAQK